MLIFFDAYVGRKMRWATRTFAFFLPRLFEYPRIHVKPFGSVCHTLVPGHFHNHNVPRLPLYNLNHDEV